MPSCLLVTGKFTIKLHMESILWSSFTVVSGKWELCFHGHKPSNSFTVRKNPELPCPDSSWNVCSFSSLDICYLLFYNNRGLKGAEFQLCGLWGKHLNPPLLHFSFNKYFMMFLRNAMQWWNYIIDFMKYLCNILKWKAQNEFHMNASFR